MLSDGEPFPVVEGGVTLPRGWRNLEVRYGLAGSEAPVDYRFVMEGLEDEWADVGQRQIAYYRHLRPGSYTLRIEAVGSDGVNLPEATLGVEVTPYLYETGWFRAVLALFLLAAAGATYRLQLGRSARRAADLERTVDERTQELQNEKERTEAALQQAQNDRAVAERALATVEAQALQLLELDHLKSRFFANVSHELRTPLTLVLDVLDGAEAGVHGPLPPEFQEQIQQAARNARSLLRHINDLLDLAKLDAGGMTVDTAPGELVGAVRESVEAFAPLAERSGVTLRFSTDAERLLVLFDRAKVEQILYNLLSNAFKATATGDKVLVTLHTAGGTTDEQVRVDIRVQDTGTGIASDALPHLFDRFFQAGDTAPSGGTGLGLALVRELVELHDGQVAVESVEGFGSTFTVSLTLTRHDSELPEGETAVFSPVPELAVAEVRLSPLSGPEAAPVVLVAEDNLDVAAVLRRHLAPRVRLLEARDGTTALALARTHAPDLILSDVVMPELDGFGLLEAVRADSRLAETPFVVLSARASGEDRLHGLRLGADDYITKPFRGPELVLRIENLVRSRRQLRETYATQVFLGGHSEPVTSADAAWMAKVYEAIAAHLADDSFTVGALAREAGVSESQLKRKLRALADTTPVELIRDVRLDRAAVLLAGEAGTVGEVAAAVGFGSPSYFAKCFRARFGVAPSVYQGEAEAADGTSA